MDIPQGGLAPQAHLSGDGVVSLPSVAAILQLPELASGDPVDVAGVAKLNNQVRWAHVSELIDIAPLLAGGELLLTTGIALDTGDLALAAY